MMIGLRALPLALIATVLGCGPVDTEAEDEFAQAEAAIVGGVTAPSYTSVFWLFDANSGSSCSSTLIGSRTLLTAAHCADNPNGNYWATNEQNYRNAFDSQGMIPSKFIKITSKRIRTGWPNSQKYDIAMMLLQRQPTNTTPKDWNVQSVATYDAAPKKPLRAVGYGKTSGGDTSNSQRRQVDLVFDTVTTDYIYLGNGSSKGICQGDSGGPSFHTFTDGVERVVGVHSFTLSGEGTTECTYGADVRVDAHRTFVTDWLTEHEVARCDADGLCLEGCDPVDVDCDCQSDGMCTSKCTRPELDSDCPANCASDGVCATATCGRPDTDCKAIGQSCTSNAQCQYRRCLSDSTKPTAYCSQTCVRDDDCLNTMSCQGGVCRFRVLPEVNLGGTCVKGQTICTFGSDCVDPDEDGSGQCQLPCNDDTVCPNAAVCTESSPGSFHCADITNASLTGTMLPRATATYLSPTGPLSCTGAPVGPVALALLALLGVVRRRRA